MKEHNKPKRVELKKIPNGLRIYLCGDSEKKICGLENKLVAHNCDGCLFEKAFIERKLLKLKTRIYYLKYKNSQILAVFI